MIEFAVTVHSVFIGIPVGVADQGPAMAWRGGILPPCDWFQTAHSPHPPTVERRHRSCFKGSGACRSTPPPGGTGVGSDGLFLVWSPRNQLASNPLKDPLHRPPPPKGSLAKGPPRGTEQRRKKVA